jgi:transcriptional regulator with XRE-family HTH domain
MADRIFRQRVAAALRAGRKSRKLTQEELAAKAGCSVETLSNAERGTSLPGLELFFDLASILELDVTALLLPSVSRRSPSRARLAMESEAHQLARSLSEERLKLWLETGKVFERS